MLTREQAAQQLEKFRKPEGMEELVPQARKLPEPMREAALVLLDRNAQGQIQRYWDAELQKASVRARAFLARATVKERSQLFSLLLGKLAPAAELAWNVLPRLTYQQGGNRRPFHAPARSDLFGERRFNWLHRLIANVAGYHHDERVNIPWLAAWAPHLGYGADDTLGILFAAVIDARGKDAGEVFEILTASARNEHEIGTMGRHVTRALLTCAQPEAWEFVEKLLLAAQRQEGLRQVILETVDEAHPAAFRRMLRLIIDNDLVRFSAAARAINVWFGFQWDSISTGAFNKILTQIAELLDNEAARKEALGGSDAEAIYYALWATAYDNAEAALAQAKKVLEDRKPEKRFAALALGSQLGLPETRPVFLDLMDDADLRIALAAHRSAMQWTLVLYDSTATLHDGDHFGRLEKLLRRLPASSMIAMKPLLWPWTAIQVKRAALVSDLARLCGERSMGRVQDYIAEMDPVGRITLAAQLEGMTHWDADARRTALILAGDASTQVREHVLRALQRARIDKDEVVQLEARLTRKAPDLRRGIITLLLSQDDAAALASTARLLQAAQSNQRLAGLEVLRQLSQNGRQVEICRQRAREYQAKRGLITREEQTQLDAILGETTDTLSLENALGLMNPADLSPIVAPRPHEAEFVTPAAVACLQALDALVEEHKNDRVKVQTYRGEQEELLGNCQWGLPRPDRSQPHQKELTKFPLRELFETWFQSRPASQRDADGFELLRAAVWADLSSQTYHHQEWRSWARQSPQIEETLEALSGGEPFTKLQYPAIVQCFLHWLRYAHPEPGFYDFLLDANERLLAGMPTDQLLGTQEQEVGQQPGEPVKADWRDTWMIARWLNALRSPALPVEPTANQLRRCWNLLRWFDEPFRGAARRRPPLGILVQAFRHGLASEADVLDAMLGPRGRRYYWQHGREFDALQALTARKPDAEIAADPRLLALADRCRERLLAIELARGEMETPASKPATQLGALFGIEKLLLLVSALAKTGFKKTDYWRQGGYSKPAVLSALVRVTFPTEADTPEEFSGRMHQAVKAGDFPEDRLIELVFQAPQWVQHVAHYYGWPGFQEGVWWFLAHMSAFVGDLGDIDVGSELAPQEEQADNGKKELSPWQKIIQQRTPLTDDERRQGAIDMAWFRRVYQELGDKRRRRIGEAARWAGTSNKARKALHLGDVILGKANLKALIADVSDKHLKESVRLLGIFPLPEGAKRQAALDQRYRVLVDYRRYAKTLGAQSKPTAVQAAQIGLENLARTAGFPDPIRLEWAQEGRNLADLTKGPVRVTQQGVTASLFLDEARQPQLAYEKAGKPLKSLPAELKKNEEFAALLERRTELKRQCARMKESLESAMCRGDVFSAAELRSLMEHPLLAPLLERLVLAGDGILGYPAKKGQALRDFAGKLEPVKKGEALRLAHPHDLLTSGHWHEWQHECFQAERVQPFKQVFRELYVVTQQEKKDGAISLRYNGQQVNPKQATALFNARNWNTAEGIYKTFYDLKITTTVWFQCGWGTPLEVEGWTLEGVEFRWQDEAKPMALDKVPPRAFSEVMRDLDLVVSVAHRGGVDPEATASTVEMRANLLRETCALLKITNYKIKNAHVLIDGKLGDYSVHLGSAVVHRRPGGAVCILPVHAQHRGRLFLPFADDDPRTAEVLSKVLLLARDGEIQDPTILEQLH
jgi:hypothetical protein